MKKIFFTLVLALGFGSTIDAQTVISNEKMTQDGINVTVSFDIDTDVKGLPSRRKEVITPYLRKTDDGYDMGLIKEDGKCAEYH